MISASKPGVDCVSLLSHNTVCVWMYGAAHRALSVYLPVRSLGEFVE